MPVSCSALMPASGCSGVLLMCDQSTRVVMPALRHSSEPRGCSRRRPPAGRAARRCRAPRRSSRPASRPGRSPRIAASQVWRWLSTNPGMTIFPVRRRPRHPRRCSPRPRDLAVLDQHVAGVEVADVGVHRDDGPSLQQGLAHGACPFPVRVSRFSLSARPCGGLDVECYPSPRPAAVFRWDCDSRSDGSGPSTAQ